MKRALPLFLGILWAAPAAAQANPWFTLDVGAAVDAPFVGITHLASDERAFLVTFDGATVRVYAVDFSFTTGPTLSTSLHSFAGATTPQIARADAVPFVVVSAGNVTVERSLTGAPGSFATIGGSAQGISPIRFLAVDRGAANRVLASLENGGAGNDITHSVGGALPGADEDTIMATAGRVAVHNGRALALSVFDAIGTAAVETDPAWSGLGFIPLGIDEATSPLTALDDGSFVGTGAGGAAFRVADPGVAGVVDCSIPGGPDHFAIATDGVAVWMATDGGLVERVDDPAACAGGWQVAAEPTATGLTGVGGVAAAGARVVLVAGDVGGAPALAWRNRPPTGVAVGDVVLDEDDAPVPIVATPSDPDLAAGVGETFLYTWNCGGSDVVDELVTGAANNVVPPVLAGQCPPTAAVFDCTLGMVDSDGQAAPGDDFQVTVNVVDSDDPVPDGNGIAFSDADAVVDELTAFTADAAFVDPHGCLQSLTWRVEETAVPGVVIDSATTLPGASFTVNAPNVTSATPVSFTLLVSAVDTSGNQSVVVSRTFDVVDVPPPAVLLLCPASVDAGGSFTATAQPVSGTAASHDWTEIAADGTLSRPPSSAAPELVVDTGACDAGSVTVTVVPRASNDVAGAPSTCVVLVNAAPDPPTDVLVEPGAVVDVVLSAGATTTEIRAAGGDTACGGDGPFRADWDVSDLPGILQIDAPIGLEAMPSSVTVTAGAEDFLALDGVEADVLVRAVDDNGDASPFETVTLRFRIDATLGELANVVVDLAVEDGGRLAEPGAVVVVSGTVTSDIDVPLPGLQVPVLGDGLAIIPESGRVFVDAAVDANGAGCAVSGAVAVGGFVVDGLERDCPARVSFLARRGLTPGNLAVSGCTWREGSVRNCTGGVVVDVPPALSFACGSAGGGAPLVIALVGLARRRWRRRVRT